MESGLVQGSDGQRRGFRRIVYLVILLVIVPTGLLLALGIVMMALGDAAIDVISGILVVTLVGCLVTGAVLALVFLRQEAKLSKLQLDFVSKVSHELRTPLTSIRMFAEMLQAEGQADPEHTRICLATLQKEATRLSERIERLLDWGRMEAGRRSYRREPTTAQEVADRARAAFRTTTLGSDRELTVKGPTEPIAVLVDGEAMVDALVNLLSNAHKYSPAGTPIVLAASADARVVRWSVSDEGIGIPRSEHRRIFQKFYRVDERLSRAVEGSGLGLAIVQHIALGHGGRVEVVSEPGRGSTFSLVVPRPARLPPDSTASNSAPSTGDRGPNLADEPGEKLDG